MRITRAMITGTYSTGCFCEKPKLIPIRDISVEPRFDFLKAAKEFCKLNNLNAPIKNGRDKTAMSVDNWECKHGQKQMVHIEWNYQYD